MDIAELIGKKIVDANIDGFAVHLTLGDGTVFVYIASDAGYSTYSIHKEGKNYEF